MKRVILTAAAIVPAVATGILGVGAADAATGKALIMSRTISDCEYQQDVDAGITLNTGDVVNVSVSGSIWAGVWLSGTNGPAGWSSPANSFDYPLVGANRYSQLEKIGSNYTYVGYGSQTVADQPGRLAFRINDNVAGNGNGCFTIGVQVYR